MPKQQLPNDLQRQLRFFRNGTIILFILTSAALLQATSMLF